MKKKILSILLAVVMIAGMLPLSAITAFADGDTPETLTLGDIIDKVSGNYSYAFIGEVGGEVADVSVKISISETEIVNENILNTPSDPIFEKRVITSNGSEYYTADTIVNGKPQYVLDSSKSDETETIDTVLQSKIKLVDKEKSVENFLTGEETVIPAGSYLWDKFGFSFFDADEYGNTRKLCYGGMICEKESDETVYTISVLPMEHGTLSCGKSFAEGAPVTIKVTPNAGYALKQNSLKATCHDGTEKELPLIRNLDGSYTFFMPAHDVTLSAEFEALPTDYFYVENPTDDDGSVIWKKFGENVAADLEYSTDEEDWTAVILENEITVPAKGKLYFRAGAEGGLANTYEDHVSLYSDVIHNIGGDITTLLKKDGRVQKLENGYEFNDLFKDDIMLIRADELILTPKTLSSYCYTGMFFGCTNLTKAPVLPATELATDCYAGMFSGCTHLTKAPVLPATSISSDCYDNMFNGCTSLNCVTVGFKRFDGYIMAPIPGSPGMFISSTEDWLKDVAEEGTFYVPDNFDETYFEEFGRNGSSVPEGWTIEKKHAVTVRPTKNGVVNTDKETAVSGDIVKLTVTPADGYVLKQDSLKATYNDGTKDIELTLSKAINSTDTYTFIMPAYNVTLTAEFEVDIFASAMRTVSGTYSGSAKWVNDYVVHEIFMWVTLNEDEFNIESVTINGETKIATKTILDHSSSRYWETAEFNGVGAPVYDENPVTANNTTIDDFLMTPLAFTLFDMDVPVCSGGKVKIPAGSFAMDYLAFYDVQNGKTQKMYMENEHIELTREETGPFTLRELIGNVGGTYNCTETFITGQNKISANATYVFTENEFRSESMVVFSLENIIGDKVLCNAEGTTRWNVVGVDASGKPIYGEPSFNPDDTIEDFLDSVGTVNRYPVKLETEGATGTESVIIPAGSYCFNSINCYFYEILNGKALNMCIAGTVLRRVETPVHEHTFSNTWSYNELVHWHNAICEHTDIVSGFGQHNFTEETNGNATTYTCICGYQKTVYNTAGDNEGEVVTGTAFTGISLTLDSDIFINFYMNLTPEARAKGTMTFDIGGRIVTIKGMNAKYNTKENRWFFRAPLTALEMAETITATFSCDGIDYIQRYSVEEYIEKILGNTEYSDEMKMLARKIANYGYYTQEYLANIHTNVTIGDDGYAAMTDAFKTGLNATNAKTALSKYNVSVSGSSANLSLYGSTVYFDSATALNYYIKVKDGVKPEATCNGKTVTVTEYKGYTPAASEKVYIVSVKDIIAIELADNFEVKINDEITITGSVFAYCNSVINAHSGENATNSDTLAVNAMAALYEYYEAAMEYISFKLHFSIPENYKAFTENGEEITGETTLKCYKPFSFRLVPDEHYVINMVNVGSYIYPDENGLYTVSFVGGTHNVVVFTKLDALTLVIYVEGENASEMPDTKITFEYDSHEIVDGVCRTPGEYKIDIPKGKSGTIVVKKTGYQEYRQAYTADGKIEEITVNLIPND